MTWVRLDDQWDDHPKFLDVGDMGQLAWVKGLTYAARYLTDGFVPDQRIPRLLSTPRASRNACQKLVAAGLWERVEGGYQIHDYGDYQPLASTVKAQREATRERVKRFRNGVSNSVGNAVTEHVTNGVVTSDPLARARGRALDLGSELTEIQTDPVTARPAEPLSPEAQAIAAAMRAKPLLIAGLEHEVARMADEHAGHMFAKGQRLQWVLDAIGECAAKTGTDTIPAYRMSRIVGFMRNAKAPRGGDAERKPATSVAQSAEISPERQAELQKQQAEKRAKAEAARAHAQAQPNGGKHV